MRNSDQELSDAPLLGRERLQRSLLAELRALGVERGVRLVVVEGEDGVGKTALCGWLSRSARRRQLAEALDVWPGTGSGDARGLREAFLRALGGGTPTPEALAAWLGEDDPYALAGLGRLLRPPVGGLPTEESPHQELLRALLRRSARPGALPLLLRVDDVHKSPELLRLFAWLCRGAPGVPGAAVLLLLNLRREGLDPEAQRDLAALRGLCRTTWIPLEPLDDEALRELLRPQLADPGLRERVVLAADGSPLVLRELAQELVLRGALEEGQWPEDLDGLWRLRLERTFAGLPRDWRHGLELAAALGAWMPFTLWWEACSAAGLDCPAEAWATYEHSGLLVPTHHGDQRALAHPSLRRLLEAGAVAARRWPRWALAAAQALSASGEDPGEVALILARAGASRDSLAPLLAGAAARLHRGELRGAEVLLEQRRAAMDALRLTYDDPLRAEGWVLEARLRHRQLQLPLARNIAERAERVARWSDREDVRLQAQWELGLIARDTGDLALSLSSLCQAERALAALEEPLRLARAQNDLARVLFRLGALEPARARYEQALQGFTTLGVRAGAGLCRRGLGDIAVCRGEHSLGERLLQEALEDFRASGSRLNAARCANSLGELARARDDLASAETWYRAAADAWRGDPEHRDPLPELNLALVLMQRGRPMEAEPILSECMVLFIQRAQRAMLGATTAAMLPPLAARRDWGALRLHLDQARTLLAETGLVDADIALCARLGAGQCRAAGRQDLAAELERLAESQLQAMGHSDRTDPPHPR